MVYRKFKDAHTPSFLQRLQLSAQKRVEAQLREENKIIVQSQQSDSDELLSDGDMQGYNLALFITNLPTA